ncbi:MAG: hypothetical protein WC897_00655 [Candidatus Gracilibacteria bacterium]
MNESTGNLREGGEVAMSDLAKRAYSEAERLWDPRVGDSNYMNRNCVSFMPRNGGIQFLYDGFLCVCHGDGMVTNSYGHDFSKLGDSSAELLANAKVVLAKFLGEEDQPTSPGEATIAPAEASTIPAEAGAICEETREQVEAVQKDDAPKKLGWDFRNSGLLCFSMLGQRDSTVPNGTGCEFVHDTTGTGKVEVINLRGLRAILVQADQGVDKCMALILDKSGSEDNVIFKSGNRKDILQGQSKSGRDFCEEDRVIFTTAVMALYNHHLAKSNPSPDAGNVSEGAKPGESFKVECKPNSAKLIVKPGDATNVPLYYAFDNDTNALQSRDNAFQSVRVRITQGSLNKGSPGGGVIDGNFDKHHSEIGSGVINVTIINNQNGLTIDQVKELFKLYARRVIAKKKS